MNATCWVHVENQIRPIVIHFRVEMEEAPLVKTAANLFRRFCYQYRDQTIAGIICSGWDEREGGQVYESIRAVKEPVHITVHTALFHVYITMYMYV